MKLFLISFHLLYVIGTGFDMIWEAWGGYDCKERTQFLGGRSLICFLLFEVVTAPQGRSSYCALVAPQKRRTVEKTVVTLLFIVLILYIFIILFIHYSIANRHMPFSFCAYQCFLFSSHGTACSYILL